MAVDKIRRISVLKVPVDIVAPEDLESAIRSLYADGKNHQIVLLSMADLMRARRSGEFRTMVTGASLVVPISLSIVKAARMTKRAEPVRYEPFDFIIQLLGILDRFGKSVYLFGASPRSLIKAEKNIKATFRDLRVVGRHSRRIPKGFLPKIVEAIRKSTPTLLMVGNGVPGGEKWIPRNLRNFSSGLYLWCSDVLDVFAERRKRPAPGSFAHGLEWAHYLPRHPWRFFRFLTLFRMKILALWYRIRGH
ncbi:MAG TPA: WecB/TagA/CpsF family glycosyltransferase [Spirochaetales bacterium]|nr:WecB/TagA/CpsF family glycosyltransferase [Spirochaetales bacterium]MBP7264908.1 WecB/TagA/CpsF family glycosyltransferase [Spirochaetia bacterium]HPE35571.1 WecB/TagA/CpsF family glycosyltransferase [Spirochaetales bacterium]